MEQNAALPPEQEPDGPTAAKPGRPLWLVLGRAGLIVAIIGFGLLLLLAVLNASLFFRLVVGMMFQDCSH